MKQRKARVVYSYTPQNQDELELKVDEVIDVLEEVEEGWWKGRLNATVGVFPSNFVCDLDDSSSSTDLAKSASSSDLDSDILDGSNISKTPARHSSGESYLEIKPTKKPIGVPAVPIPIGFHSQLKSALGMMDEKRKKAESLTPTADSEPAPKLPPKPVKEQAKVLYAYEAQNEDELSIKEGEIINIISKEIEDQGWWRGELNGKLGVFPDNFVELIKSTPTAQEKPEAPLKVVKPERPGDKASHPVGSPPKPVSVSGLPKDKSLPVKEESKVFSLISKLPGLKPKADKPDVVPQQDEKEPRNDADTGMDLGPALSNILKHPTTDRPRGPSRRPPSYYQTQLSKDLDDGLENGNSEKLSPSEKSDSAVKNELKPTQPPSLSSNAPSEPSVPDWMKEFKKRNQRVVPGVAQGSPSVTTAEPETPPPRDSLTKPSVPAKNNVNRLSKDFSDTHISLLNQPSKPVSAKLVPVSQQKPITTTTTATNSVGAIATAASNATNVSSSSFTPSVLPSSALSTQATSGGKSVVGNSLSPSALERTTSSNLGSTIERPPSVTSNSQENSQLASSVASLPQLSPSTHCVISGQTKGSAGDSTNGDLSELRNELRALKENYVSKKEHDELLKQVSELKKIVEEQKHSYRTAIKDLINDVAEERKKLATLQIEVDRLRKLTTTV
ncbi:CD2-associated protein [Halotydeus destructor]|nr:CD2-associated protein [Halotydeus destructor]